MAYHPVTKKITDLLKEKNCWFETFEHEPVRTSEEAAKTRTGYSLHQGAKAMIIKAKGPTFGEKFVMLVMPADLRFDNDKVKAVLKARETRFATEQEIAAMTGGVQIGGVPPFGNLFNLEVVADPELFKNEKIVFNAGDRCFSVAMKTVDYKKLVAPAVESIT
ncbi:hypothetical protein HY440_01195 [Candidatus Microgenomates bacterium]|nr:hypothetical protein [Candidatus Microgenomates bacterium]